MSETEQIQASERHPHEPQIPPALDADGRCLVCRILGERDGLRFALEGLLNWAERYHAGDPSLNPEEWYVERDFVRKCLSQCP